MWASVVLLVVVVVVIVIVKDVAGDGDVVVVVVVVVGVVVAVVAVVVEVAVECGSSGVGVKVVVDVVVVVVVVVVIVVVVVVVANDCGALRIVRSVGWSRSVVAREKNKFFLQWMVMVVRVAGNRCGVRVLVDRRKWFPFLFCPSCCEDLACESVSACSLHHPLAHCVEQLVLL